MPEPDNPYVILTFDRNHLPFLVWCFMFAKGGPFLDDDQRDLLTQWAKKVAEIADEQGVGGHLHG